jgi:hypothetical protein
MTRSQVIATWKSTSGAVLTFFPDQHFIAKGLDLSAFGDGCRNISGRGTWQFLSPQGVSGPNLNSYSKGNVLGLIFTSGIRTLCSGSGPQFTTWEPDSTVGLCLYVDPDSPCTGELFAKER